MKAVATILVILFLVLAGFQLYHKHNLDMYNAIAEKGMVRSNGYTLPVFTSPRSEDNLHKGDLKDGTEVSIKSVHDEWFEIVTKNGMSGWVKSESVRPLAGCPIAVEL